MKWALVDEQNIVQNIIVYDGTAIYEPPADLYLEQINGWIDIGQNINTPEPVTE